VDSRQLRYFVTVAEELHFGRAAERLKIAQPPLSQQIQKFERELGVKLFERTSRKVELTAAGRELLGEARLILDRIDTVRRHVQEFAGGKTGVLEVGAVSPALDTFLPSVIQQFITSYPQIGISLHELRTHEQFDWLRTSRLDLGFVRLDGSDLCDLESLTILREPYMLAIPKGHELANRRSLELKSLDGAKMIMAPRHRRPLLHDRILSSFKSAGAVVNIVQEALSKRTEIALVAAGVGLALVPESYSRIFQRPNVVYRPLKGSLPEIELAAIWKEGRVSPACRILLDQLSHFRR
jgi:DNA-binding transcriptional LysR family regulator